MRITCPDCQKSATVTHRVPLTKGIDDLYCTCKHCGSRLVFSLSFKHHVETASPATVAAALLRSLPATDRQRLFNEQPDLFLA